MMMHPKMMYTYVGIDSHKDTHTAVFLNCFYEKLGELTVSTVPATFPDFLKEAEKYRLEGTTLAFGFEDISSYGRSLVKYLVDRGYLVRHVNASLVASERNSRNVLKKTDSIDGESVARVLLNRFNELPIASPDDTLWTLKTLVTRRESIYKINNMLTNHLHSLIYGNYPSHSSFFSDITCHSALAFYEAYPSPGYLMDSSLEELTELLKASSRNLFGTKKAQEIWNAVENDKVFDSKCEAVRNTAIRSAVSQLKLGMENQEAIEGEIAVFLEMFDYPLTSMNGIDTLTAAKIISEVGDISRFRSAAALASYAGIAPATYASGQTNIQYANKRGNRTLNKIFFNIALGFIVLRGKDKIAINPFFYDYYQKKISEGKTKRQALKCVQRRLVNIIFGIMKYKTDYINPPISYPERDQLLESKKHQSSLQ